MGIAPLQQRAMEDQLRRMQLQIDALERRMATGDAISFAPLLTPGSTFPTMDVYAEYIRVNRLVSHHVRCTLTSGSTLGVSPKKWTIKCPYPFEFASGIWNLRNITGPGTSTVVASGVVAEADAATYGDDRVALYPIKVGSWEAWSLLNDRVSYLNFTDAFGAFSIGYQSRAWSSTEIIEVTWTTRVPDGS